MILPVRGKAPPPPPCSIFWPVVAARQPDKTTAAVTVSAARSHLGGQPRRKAISISLAKRKTSAATFRDFLRRPNAGAGHSDQKKLSWRMRTGNAGPAIAEERRIF